MTTAATPMTPNHGLLRRLLYVGLNSKAVKTYETILEEEARLLVDRLISHPQADISFEIHRAAEKTGLLGLKPTSIAARMVRAQGSPIIKKLAPVAAVSAVSEGINATTSLLLTFVEAIARNQEVQARAQAEVDTLGDGQPTFEDRQFLPYVEAVIKEALRYDPSNSIGSWHFDD
ncbi:hypothetical protein FRB96_000722 [Tulasnella sp. 330]|nr:hypothetical protein FRB96_000722 [Tulasnella sp. 330]